MISGTIVFSTGLLLVALGFVLRELRAIAGSAGRATLLLAKAKTLHLKDFDEDSAELLPPRGFVPEERVAAAEFAPAEEEFEPPAARETDWKAARALRLHLPRVDEIAEAGASMIPNPLAWMVRPEKPEPLSPPPPPPPLQDEEFESWLEPEHGNFAREPLQESPVEPLHVAELPANRRKRKI